MRKLFACCLAALPHVAHSEPHPAVGAGWQVAGELGLMKLVVVSGDRMRERAFYDGIVTSLCAPDQTCFVRFFANTSGAPVGMPLPDAIFAEPAASFQRSAKQNNEVFEWSCRMKMPGNCF